MQLDQSKTFIGDLEVAFNLREQANARFEACRQWITPNKRPLRQQNAPWSNESSHVRKSPW
jgi:hypothetical protein